MRLFRRLSRAHALRLGFGAMLALLMFSAVEAIRIQSESSRHTTEIYRRFVRKGEALAQIRRQLYLASIYTRDLFLRPEASRVAVFQDQITRLQRESDSSILELERLTGGDSSIAALKADLSGFWAKLESVMTWAGNAGPQRGFDFIMREVVPRRNATADLLNAHAEANQSTLEDSEDEFNGSRRAAANRLLLILGGTMGVGILVAWMSLAHAANLERENELRLQQATAARQESQHLSARLLDIQESERKRLACELLDEIGQTLHALRLEISQAKAAQGAEGAAEPLDRARGLAEGALATVRNISLLLRPHLLDDLGLGPALQWLAEDFSRRAGIRCVFTEEGLRGGLPDSHRTCVYRVVQEALHNCGKHSGASNVRVLVRQERERLLLEIEDDGRGFEAGGRGRPVHSDGLGILGMRERAAMLGGEFTLQSAPGRGTRIVLSLPLPEPEVHA